jgi:hypothetical protein
VLLRAKQEVPDGLRQTLRPWLGQRSRRVAMRAPVEMAGSNRARVDRYRFAHMSPQEQFWSGRFGDEYTKRNRVDWTERVQHHRRHGALRPGRRLQRRLEPACPARRRSEHLNRCRLCVIPTRAPTPPSSTASARPASPSRRRESIDWEAPARPRAAPRAHARTAVALGNDYDCIVPSSGGKDSHYQVLTLIEHRRAAARRHRDDLPPDADRPGEHRQPRALRDDGRGHAEPRSAREAEPPRPEMVGDISWPEHVASSRAVPRRAQLGIPLLFYGENPQNQYGGPLGSSRRRCR